MLLLVLDQLACSLAAQSTIETLEISNSGLTNTHAPLIKKIINTHATRRNEATWITGLRSEDRSKLHEKQGLLELVLQNNKISDQFVKDLLPILNFDQYLKAIDLRGNEITDSVMEELLGWINNSSKNVVYFDVRNNPGYSEKYHCEIVHALLRNIKALKNDRRGFKIALDRGWISQELLEFAPFTAKVEEQAINERKEEEKKVILEKEEEVPKAELKVEMVSVKKTVKIQKSSSSGKIDLENMELPDVRSISYSKDFSGGETGDCKKCANYFKELMQSESRCIALTMENRSLRKQLQFSSIPYISGIHPVGTHELQSENVSMTGQINSSTKYVCGTGDDGSGEIKHRIDYLMGELTRLMDLLENPASTSQGNVSDNVLGNVTGGSTSGAATGVPRISRANQ